MGAGSCSRPLLAQGAGLSQRRPDCVSSVGTDRAGGAEGKGGARRARGFQRQGLAAQADCGLEAWSGLAIVFSLAFWRAPYYLFLFSLFYFYFQVAGRTGCRPFTPLPWSAARRRREPAQAQPHRPPGRRRLPGRAGRGAGAGGGGNKGWGVGGGEGVAELGGFRKGAAQRGFGARGEGRGGGGEGAWSGR